VSGDISTELSPQSHDAFIEAALFGTWTTTDTGTTTLSIASNAVTRGAGSFVTDGFVVGQWVQLSGFANAENNTWGKVTAVSATSMTIAGATLTDETGSGSERVHAQYAVGGTTARYYSISKRFRDIGQEIVFAGCLVDSMKVEIAPNAAMALAFTINGMNETVNTTLPATATDVSTADPFTSFSGSVLLDNVVNSNMTKFSAEVPNNLSDGFVIGSRFKVAQFAGRQLPTGDVSFYFEDLTEYQDSIAHTAKSIDISAGDANGNYFALGVPRAYIDIETPKAGDEGPMMLNGKWRGRLDSTLGSSIIISTSIA